MPEYTKEQAKAIDYHGKDILVSASAGSGKTTVLVQRVLKEILSGIGVDELLIVTFTKAAAEEMKQRIKNELTKAIRKENHKDRRIYLQRQLNNVDTANISTIDAFCLDVIHRFYYAADLDPSFSILTDETQAALMKERALREIEAETLEGKDSQEFEEFYNNFVGDRDNETARGLLLDLYNYAMAKPNYRQWLRELPNQYKIGDSLVNSDVWQKQIKPYLLATLKDLQNKIQRLLDEEIFQTDKMAKQLDNFKLFFGKLNVCISDLDEDQDYDSLRSDLQNCRFTIRTAKSKKWDEDIQEFFEETTKIKKEAQDTILSIFSQFFATGENEQLAAMKKARRITQTIVKSEQKLIDRFNQFKREENVLDYTDMEQIAFQILSQDTSNSQLAREFYQNKFKEILVDEYQDINNLQEQIIQQIKNEDFNHLFMVGDVKQSIYGFRQAEPSLFLQKYHDYGDKENINEERILLSDNFRSTEPVTKIVNQIFTKVLSKDFGGIDYQGEGQLIFGANYYPKNLSQSSEILYHKKERNSNTSDDDSTDNFSEIQMVISRIKQFKKEKMQIFDAKSGQLRPFEYKDIAILTRSRSNNLQIMQEFAKNDIPLFITDAQNYFQTFELTVIMNYLKVIDNPDQDIPLTTVLRSPIFNFSNKELGEIRANNKTSSFYNAVLDYVGKNNALSEKVKLFLNQLESLRSFATTHRISELIWSIYERTNLLEIMTALPNGEQRRANLESLYERASSYESAGFKGIYQFINFISRMRKSQKDLAQPLLSKEADNSVRLMTIHGSKGLEFPIVFYVGLEHKYQKTDSQGDYVLTSDTLGLTIKRETDRLNSLVRSMAQIQKSKQNLEEEARILYVAVTRAKQKLILVADIPNFDKDSETWSDKNNLSLTDKLSATNPLSFVGPTLNFKKNLPTTVDSITSSVDQNSEFLYINFDEINEEKVEKEKHTEDNIEHSLLTKAVTQLFDFKYPFADASRTNAYQAVSELNKSSDPDEKDLDNSKMIRSSNRYLQKIDTRPNFLFDSNFTGTEVGTATHLILQYFDYTGDGSEQQLDEEINTLILQKKLDPSIVPSLKKDEILWFVNSDFAKVFAEKPENLKREVEFSMLRPVNKNIGQRDFSDKNAKILVHGAIDGYYIENDGIILFDYKTDHIDLSNLDFEIEKLKTRYKEQLQLYEDALNDISKQKVKSKYLILLSAKKVVQID
ncbi:helicase-exonuclease AddAB subunit AddA [Lactobacillus kalixensis]|uniref:ATP-dependent helicase/nuclease subunit A n=1 Tax=Lactobacillus kalixensis DSM 16043 TaxID=1423763 RepID=A0A0R1UB75_9LACO|nr:helicase-exonuclease AddAB subunit AddA [Lactobacillus kalixensis]KRL90623.1 ATP-dependent helicase nuclease subunit a [Lactobacillus kalixensis DSM 16043]